MLSGSPSSVVADDAGRSESPSCCQAPECAADIGRKSRFSPDKAQEHAPSLVFPIRPVCWPLTVVPTASRPKRSISTWMFLGAIVALGAGLLLVWQPDIPSWTN